MITRGSSQQTSSWAILHSKCVPILMKLAEAARTGQERSWNAYQSSVFGRGRLRRSLLQVTDIGSSSSNSTAKAATAQVDDASVLALNPYLNSTDAVMMQYGSLMCAQGYDGVLCTNCIFPGGVTYVLTVLSGSGRQ